MLLMNPVAVPVQDKDYICVSVHTVFIVIEICLPDIVNFWKSLVDAKLKCCVGTDFFALRYFNESLEVPLNIFAIAAHYFELAPSRL